MSTRARCRYISNIEGLQPHSRPRRQKLGAEETSLTLDGARQSVKKMISHQVRSSVISSSQNTLDCESAIILSNPQIVAHCFGLWAERSSCLHIPGSSYIQPCPTPWAYVGKYPRESRVKLGAFSHGHRISFWHLPNQKGHLADTATAVAITRMNVACLFISHSDQHFKKNFHGVLSLKPR